MIRIQEYRQGFSNADKDTWSKRQDHYRYNFSSNTLSCSMCVYIIS